MIRSNATGVTRLQTKFWNDAWASGKQGWRQQRVNTRLQRFWSEMGASAGNSVFVPLCGDSIDIIWLLEQGHDVVGSELSEMAVRQFYTRYEIPFSEQDSESTHQVFEGHMRGQRVRFLCGDFFDLQPEQLGSVAAVYDRAALVAMPDSMRVSYASQLQRLIRKAPVLLITMVYDQSKMNGPPFSVPHEEIEHLYGNDFTIAKLSTSSGPEILGNLAERGLDTLEETVYKLTHTVRL